MLAKMEGRWGPVALVFNTPALVLFGNKLDFIKLQND